MADSGILASTANLDYTTATDNFLLEMLLAGRISSYDYDELRSSLAAERHQHAHHLPGNVSLYGFAQYEQLEAISKVLNTSELLEQILVNLPLQTLLVGAQTACKGFKRAMDKSSAIRRQMFLLDDMKQTPGVLPLLFTHNIVCGVHEISKDGATFDLQEAGLKVLMNWSGPTDFLLMQPASRRGRISGTCSRRLPSGGQVHGYPLSKEFICADGLGLTLAHLLDTINNESNARRAELPMCKATLTIRKINFDSSM
ncbi:hypothetical protein LTR37_002612 [Vermiconidia calcicola]|uniref:Uncharacterized protein n=1 Tax=Vermiconidia calcicola TaxID=1690605 RepID=A0ACC3NS78_9PEZI|nr:hypothetical protein LTR37_002612 [Vermiconidia calcicola]